MPTVPRAPTQRVQTEALRQPDVTLRSNILETGRAQAQATRAVGRAVSDVANVFEAKRREADDIQFAELESQFTINKNTLQGEVSQRKGKNAVGARDFARSRWEELNKPILEQANPRVKARLEAVGLAHFGQVDNFSQRHELQQIQEYDNNVTTTSIKTAQDDAVVNYTNPEVVQMSLAKVEAAIRLNGQRQGQASEVIEANISQAKSATHSKVLSRMVNKGEDLTAQNYFKRFKDQFTGADLAKAEAVLEEASIRGESQRTTDQLLAKFDNQQEALKKARDIKDPKLRDETVRRVKSRFQEQKILQEQAEEQIFESAINTIESTGSTEEIPREDWAQFSLPERNGLIKYAQDAKRGIRPETNWETYYDLKTQASVPGKTREKFMRTNLIKLRSELSDTEFKEMIKLQTDLRQGKGSSKTLDGFRSDNQIVNDIMRSAGIDPTPNPGTDESKEVALLRQRIEEIVRVRQDRTGKKITNDELTDIANTMITEVVTDRGFIFDTTKRVFELGPEDQVNVRIDDIPTNERLKIESAFRRKGIPVTEDKIVDMYIRKLDRIAPRGE